VDDYPLRVVCVVK